MVSDDCIKQLFAHYTNNWGEPHKVGTASGARALELGEAFRVLIFAPRPNRDMWTYATVGMCAVPEDQEGHGLELHLFSPSENEDHVELLAAVTHYHLTEARLGVGHTVNFGRGWYPGSKCSYGLISLPYLDGPAVEWMNGRTCTVRFLWLVPITGTERNYKMESGLEALEQRLEEADFSYVDPSRSSVV